MAGIELVTGMGGPTDHWLVAEDAPRHGHRQIVLTQMEDRSPDGQGHIGAVVRREQRAVPLSGRREDLEEPDLIRGLEAFLPQLHDVDATREDGVEEIHEVAFTRSGVGAQVEPGVGEPGITGAATIAGGGTPSISAMIERTSLACSEFGGTVARSRS